MPRGSRQRTSERRQVGVDLAALRAGDPTAFAAWVRSVGPAVLGFLRASGVREAEDVLQEVWIRLVRALPQFEGDEAGLRSLTFTIAYRARADFLRRQFVRSEQPHDPLTIPDAAAQQSALEEDSGQVVRLLAHLPEHQATVIGLRVFAGYNSREVATLLEMPEGTVRSLTQRGLKKLAALLAPTHEHDLASTETER